MNARAPLIGRETPLGEQPAAEKIAIHGVSKEFPHQSGGTFCALRDISLSIRDGEFVSLLGPSGCGKSTLLEIVAGLQQPTAGEVLVDQARVLRPGPERAVVFQHYALFPWRNVRRNVELAMEFTRQDRTVRKETALRLIREVGLEGFAEHPVWQLSGGMQQRVTLARALACSPKVLLLDEPFSGADAITRELLQQQLLRLHAATGMTMLLVTHSVDEAILLSNRVVVLGTRPGRIVDEYSIGTEEKKSAASAYFSWRLLYSR